MTELDDAIAAERRIERELKLTQIEAVRKVNRFLTNEELAYRAAFRDESDLYLSAMITEIQFWRDRDRAKCRQILADLAQDSQITSQRNQEFTK